MKESQALREVRKRVRMLEQIEEEMRREERLRKQSDAVEARRLRDFLGCDPDGLIFIGNISVNTEATTFEQKVRSAVMFRNAYGLGPVKEGQSLRELEFENWCAGCACRKFHLYPDDLSLAPLEAPDSLTPDTFTTDWQHDPESDRTLSAQEIEQAQIVGGSHV